jgi:predicted RNase H-like HicB family nuclease
LTSVRALLPFLFMRKVRVRRMKPRIEGRFTVIIEACPEGGYFAECPVLAGCHVEAETYENVVSEMRAAIRAHLADFVAAGESIPKAEITVTSLNVSV